MLHVYLKVGPMRVSSELIPITDERALPAMFGLPHCYHTVPIYDDACIGEAQGEQPCYASPPMMLAVIGGCMTSPPLCATVRPERPAPAQPGHRPPHHLGRGHQGPRRAALPHQASGRLQPLVRAAQHDGGGVAQPGLERVLERCGASQGRRQGEHGETCTSPQRLYAERRIATVVMTLAGC